MKFNFRNSIKSLFLFFIIIAFTYCSKKDQTSTLNLSYKVVAEVDCPFNRIVQDISNDVTYVSFDVPGFVPNANTWYKDENNYYWKIGADVSPSKTQLSHRVLISKHYSSYCQ
jgi:hypothetical protein